ncbi:MAG TPA: hypothetical protein VIM73_03700 [Polyangiaceae bacterium]
MQPRAFDGVLDGVEAQFELLRALYEDYFAGSVAEPRAARKEMSRCLARLQTECPPGERESVRLRNLLARFESFEQYWERIGSRVVARARSKRVADSPLRRITLRQGSMPIDALTENGVARPISPEHTPPLGTRVLLGVDSDSAPSCAGHGFADDNEAPTSQTTLILSPEALEKLLGAGDELHSASDGEMENSSARLRSSESGSQEVLRARLGLPRERVDELHAKLRSLSPPNTRVVGVEGLARALEKAEAKLRAEHGDCTVTFDIVVKQGRPLVRPVVR